MRDFYDRHFIGQWPDDTETQQISRTVGEDQVVDELLMTFTHDRRLDIMLPGIPATGRRITVPVVVVVGFKEGKVSQHLLGPSQRAGSSRPGSTRATYRLSGPSRPTPCSISSAPRTSCSVEPEVSESVAIGVRSARWATVGEMVACGARLQRQRAYGGGRRPMRERPVCRAFLTASGGGGIRTLVTPLRRETVFETAAFNHSATPPRWSREG